MRFVVTTRIPPHQPVADVILATAFDCTEAELSFYWLAMSPDQRLRSNIQLANDVNDLLPIRNAR